MTEPEAPWAQPEPPVRYGRPDRLTRLVTRAWTRSPAWVAPVALLACMGAAAGYTLVAVVFAVVVAANIILVRRLE